MAILLDLMERQIAVFKAGGTPDFALVRGILDYFLSYPDLYHHPKEDLIFHKLRARDPDRAAALNALLSGHEDLALLTRRFAHATIDQMLHPEEVARQWFGSLARDFVDTNRRHMASEEEAFFPAALQVLSAEDWADVEAVVAGRDDPLFGEVGEGRFRHLRDAIVELERAAAPDRA